MHHDLVVVHAVRGVIVVGGIGSPHGVGDEETGISHVPRRLGGVTHGVAVRLDLGLGKYDAYFHLLHLSVYLPAQLRSRATHQAYRSRPFSDSNSSRVM